MKRLLPLPLIAWLCLVCAACGGSRSPLPDDVARTLKTPDGSEAKIVCPPSISELLKTADPGKVATAEAGFNIKTAVPPEGLFPPGALTPVPNSLKSLVPAQSPTGRIDCCSEETNEDFGAQFGGGFASEVQLNQMGRLCGLTASRGMSMRVDLYEATAGASEAYKLEAKTMKESSTGEAEEPQDGQLFNSIGDQRLLKRILTIENDQRLDNDDYELLFVRRNVVARIRLSYGSFAAPGKGPPDPLLQYAAQLDQNIEAAAQQ